MKILYRLSTLIVTVVLSGCIAGAATDSAKSVHEARNYPEYLGREVRKETNPSPVSALRRSRDQLLAGFLNRQAIIQKTTEEGLDDVGDVQIGFRAQQVTVVRNGSTIMQTQLPHVFYYSGIQVASHRVGNKSFNVLLAYSRQTTSMVWIGVFDENWERQYLTVLPLHKVWNIMPTPEGLMIIGASIADQIQLKFSEAVERDD